MARTRSSAPLLEVIDPSRPLTGQARRGVFSRIAGWFRPAPAVAPAAPSGRSAPEAHPAGTAPSEPSPAPSVPAGDSSSAPSAAAQPPAAGREDGAAPVPAVRRVAIDPQHREIVFRLTYGSTAVWVMLFLTSIGAAFLAGQQRAAGPRPAVAPLTVDSLRSQPPQGQVANLAATGRTQTPPPPEPVAAQPAAASPGAAAPAGGPAQVPVVRDRNRTVGLNYVVIQSYPDAKMAADAMNILIQNGIDCTVEKGLPGWGSPSWHSVVGVDGFARITGSPQYDAYIRRIKEISDRFARRGSFRAFDPKPYKWGRSAG